MSTLNVVTNNAPTHAIATIIESLVSDANQTKGPSLPGSSGEQNNSIQKQLVAGNPGGIGAPAGLGITVNAGA
jgi:hypothetical protein